MKPFLVYLCLAMLLTINSAYAHPQEISAICTTFADVNKPFVPDYKVAVVIKEKTPILTGANLSAEIIEIDSISQSEKVVAKFNDVYNTDYFYEDASQKFQLQLVERVVRQCSSEDACPRPGYVGNLVYSWNSTPVRVQVYCEGIGIER